MRQMRTTILRRGSEALLELLYPRRCVGCGNFGDLICEHCRATGFRAATGQGRCPHCCAEWAESGNCPRCFSLQSLDRAVAAFEMDGCARRAVLTLKFRHVRMLAEPMAEDLASLAGIAPFDVAFPVPLHPSRERERGFNQAAELVRRTGWPVGPGRLLRTRRTPHQVGGTERERRRNVTAAFDYAGPALDGLTVAVVDDVITTGATVNEIGAVLREHGARSVVAVAYARKSYAAGHSGGIED